MPKPKIARADSFVEVEEEGAEERFYLPASEMNALMDGVPGLPSAPYVPPAKKLAEAAERERQLREQIASLMQQGGTSSLDLQDGTLVVHDFRLTPTGLIAPDEMTQESWEEVGRLLFRLEGSIQWLIGDWLVYGGAVGWGDLPKLAKALGRDYQTLRNYTVVCRAYDLYRRRYNLTFGHYQAAASLVLDQQDESLAYAESQGMSVAAFRAWLKQGMPEDGVREELPAERQPPQYLVTELWEKLQAACLRPWHTLNQRDRKAKLDDIATLRHRLDEIERWLKEGDGNV